MFSFFKKYSLPFYTLAFIVFGLGTYFNFNDYFTLEYDNPKSKKIDLFGGIVFGILTTIYLIGVINLLKNKRTSE